MHWSTDRRAFLRLSGAAFAAAATAPRFAWAAEAGTLRLRVTADFQVLDPFGIIGELDDIIPRMTQVTLLRISDVGTFHVRDARSVCALWTPAA
jgi:peptide/nickel transport system substrate-binding protein